MKKIIVFLLIGSLLAGSLEASTEKLSAREWATITRQRKIYFILGSMEAFQEKGYIFRHTMDDYMTWMNQAVKSKSSAKSMDDLFSKAVFSHEAKPVPVS